MKLEAADIKELIAQFDESGISELKLESEDVKLVLKKDSGVETGTQAGAPVWSGSVGNPFSAPMPQSAPFPWPTPGGAGPMSGAPYTGAGTAPAEETVSLAAPAAAEAAEEPKAASSATAVTAPLAGIFYRAPKPGEDPFVEVGSKVKKGDTVGLIEAMKIINEIPAPCDGTVADILIEDGEFAQFGAELLSID